MARQRKLTDERLNELAKVRRSQRTRLIYSAQDEEIRAMAIELIWVRAAMKPKPLPEIN